MLLDTRLRISRITDNIESFNPYWYHIIWSTRVMFIVQESFSHLPIDGAAEELLFQQRKSTQPLAEKKNHKTSNGKSKHTKSYINVATKIWKQTTPSNSLETRVLLKPAIFILLRLQFFVDVLSHSKPPLIHSGQFKINCMASEGFPFKI